MMTSLPEEKPMPTHPTIGLPYAAAVIDAHGYAVECPECGFLCRPEGSSGHATVEDDVTKGANAVYALHYERDHQ